MTATSLTPRTDAVTLRANQYTDDAQVVPAILARELETALRRVVEALENTQVDLESRADAAYDIARTATRGAS